VVGKRQFYFPCLFAKGQRRFDDIVGLVVKLRSARIDKTSATALNKLVIFLNRMHVEMDVLFPIFFEGVNVEGVELRRLAARVNSSFDRGHTEVR